MDNWASKNHKRFKNKCVAEQWNGGAVVDTAELDEAVTVPSIWEEFAEPQRKKPWWRFW